MIGNAGDARLALLGDLLEIGAGNYRTVYWANDVVYKVENHEGIGQNTLEFNRAASHRDSLPEPFMLPSMSLYTVKGSAILAAECIKGEPVGICSMCLNDWQCDDPDACVAYLVPKWFTFDTWSDTAYGNAIRNESGIYIVDFVW